MWTEDLLLVLAQPYAAFELAPGGRTQLFDDLAAMCGWMLDRKEAMRLSLRDTHLVWGEEPLDQRATVTLELRSGEMLVESWRLTTAMPEDAAAVLQAVRSCRAARKAVH